MKDKIYILIALLATIALYIAPNYSTVIIWVSVIALTWLEVRSGRVK